MKIDDVIVCDEMVNFAIQTGCGLSKCKILVFKHNDMSDLEVQLKKANDISKGNNVFLAIQGIYENTGQIAPLDKIMALKKKYFVRVFLEDTMAFGVLGKTGRGTPEFFGVPIDDVEFYVANLEAALATIGGFCTGDKLVVDHQRLSGKGYCFSASSPPYLCTAAIEGLKILTDTETNEGQKLLLQLRENSISLRKNLEANNTMTDLVQISGANGSPIVHVLLNLDDDKAKGILRKTADTLLSTKGIAVAFPKYSEKERKKPRPSLRITVTAEHTKAEILNASKTIMQTLFDVISSKK